MRDKNSECDLLVYGGESGGVIAAIQADRMGKSVILVSQYAHLGGMTTSGLGWTDFGNTKILGGLAREFYHRVYKCYEKNETWEHQARSEFHNKAQGDPALNPETELACSFEPKVAEGVLNEMLKETKVECIYGRLNLEGGVIKNNQRIESIELEDGSMIKSKMFLDASYEGDLMACAGLSYSMGRESNNEFKEDCNGITPLKDGLWDNQLPSNIDPFIVEGDPKSGLLPGVNPGLEGEIGEGDDRIQAYCYRMVLTDKAENRVSITQPKNYDEREYEILFRAIKAGQKHSFFKTDFMPNRKTDSNNLGGVSCDFIGGNYGEDWNWMSLGHVEREQLAEKHRDWQLGLVWTLQNHSRVPLGIREELSVWGLPKDEFTDNHHWPYCLYVRESRRLKTDFIMTEQHCRNSPPVQDPIAMGAYTLDSHNVQRVVIDGMLRNEGDIQSGLRGKPYGIAYKSIVPKKEECKNLLVPWALSASHIAFGSIRMEPVFMMLGQSAATAACLAISKELAVQDLDYSELQERLLSDDQRLSFDG